jgi:DNA-binding transcriptional MerR regulator
LVPGSPQRVREMSWLRAQGFSLDEIAVRYDVSRERVRQILRAHGGPDAQDVAQARRRRVEQQAEERVDELLALWRAGQGTGDAAGALGLQAAACRGAIARCATDVDRAARRVSMSHARSRKAKAYREEDILDALTGVAARLGHVPSPREYEALARELELPSLTTVLVRLGDWATAVRAAGMQPRTAGRRARARRWTQDACWLALRRVVAETDEIPTVLAYERHAAGRADLPSAATIRNRLGRWSAIVTRLAAERELTTLHQPPAPQPRGA